MRRAHGAGRWLALGLVALLSGGCVSDPERDARWCRSLAGNVLAEPSPVREQQAGIEARASGDPTRYDNLPAACHKGSRGS
jgi:hypothetical protein